MSSSEVMLFLLIIAFVCMLIVARFVIFYRSFKKELNYINAEIRRTIGNEQARWKRAKKRLLLSLIPFYNPYKKKSHHKA